MYNKTIIRLGFCDILNNQGLGKCYQPISTLIIPDITKTSFNIVYYLWSRIISGPFWGSFELMVPCCKFHACALQNFTTAAGLAQSAEHLTREREVAGSIPRAVPILRVLK